MRKKLMAVLAATALGATMAASLAGPAGAKGTSSSGPKPVAEGHELFDQDGGGRDHPGHERLLER